MYSFPPEPPIKYLNNVQIIETNKHYHYFIEYNVKQICDFIIAEIIKNYSSTYTDQKLNEQQTLFENNKDYSNGSRLILKSKSRCKSVNQNILKSKLILKSRSRCRSSN